MNFIRWNKKVLIKLIKLCCALVLAYLVGAALGSFIAFIHREAYAEGYAKGLHRGLHQAQYFVFDDSEMNSDMAMEPETESDEEP